MRRLDDVSRVVSLSRLFRGVAGPLGSFGILLNGVDVNGEDSGTIIGKESGEGSPYNLGAVVATLAHRRDTRM
jgi:hypothetical protein